MNSHIQATMARIQEIEARIGGMMTPPAPPIVQSQSGSVKAAFGTNPANRPFDVMMAQAGGKVQLTPVAGPFLPEIETLIGKYAAQNSLSPDLVRAVIQQESGGNPRSVSAVGAQGLMQLMPETAQGFGVTNAFDPEQNIKAGTRYLGGLMREFQGDVSKVLAAYNAGANNVRKYNGVPPFAETQQYVQRILGMMGQR